MHEATALKTCEDASEIFLKKDFFFRKGRLQFSCSHICLWSTYHYRQLENNSSMFAVNFEANASESCKRLIFLIYIKKIKKCFLCTTCISIYVTYFNLQPHCIMLPVSKGMKWNITFNISGKYTNIENNGILLFSTKLTKFEVVNCVTNGVWGWKEIMWPYLTIKIRLKFNHQKTHIWVLV